MIVKILQFLFVMAGGHRAQRRATPRSSETLRQPFNESHAGAGIMPPSDDDWLLKTLVQENGTSFRTVWDLYLKFYTAFLTFSVLALGLTVQYIHRENRLPVILAFVFQNVLSGGTAFGMARFSKQSSRRFEHLCAYYLDHSSTDHKGLKSLCESPSPGWLGIYGGYANLLSHITLIGCWLAAYWV